MQFLEAYLCESLPIGRIIAWMQVECRVIDLTQLSVGAGHQDGGMSTFSG
jgi:hypothetical protein